MRILATEDSMDPDETPMPIERFEVVRHRKQIGFGWQPIGGMAPVPIREEAELAALDDSLDALLHAEKILRARQWPVGDRLGKRRSLRWIGLERVDDVHPVQRMQMIEMDDVVLNVLRRHDEIAQQSCIGRRHRADGLFHGAYRS